jgi:ribonuclease Z
MELTFVGTTASIPDVGEDSPCFLVNNRYLLDCGFNVCGGLRDNGILPDKIRTIFFTHMHHDHYMALPQLLFFYCQTGTPLDTLHLYGPKADLARVTDYAMNFMQYGRGCAYRRQYADPTLHEIEAGTELVTIADFDDVKIEACKNNHAIDGIALRITEHATGKVLAITGDTFYAPHLPKALHDADLLVHENTRVIDKTDYANPPANGHSSIHESMRTAMEAGAKRLAVVHFAEKHADAVIARAAELGDVPVFYPERLVPYSV